jgi:hypothetical protein
VELENLCIKIPLLQALKDVTILNKYTREECIRRPGIRRKDTPTINVVGQLADLMLGKLIVHKYLDPKSPLVNVHINNTLVQNTCNTLFPPVCKYNYIGQGTMANLKVLMFDLMDLCTKGR